MKRFNCVFTKWQQQSLEKIGDEQFSQESNFLKIKIAIKGFFKTKHILLHGHYLLHSVRRHCTLRFGLQKSLFQSRTRCRWLKSWPVLPIWSRNPCFSFLLNAGKHLMEVRVPSSTTKSRILGMAQGTRPIFLRSTLSYYKEESELVAEVSVTYNERMHQ